MLLNKVSYNLLVFRLISALVQFHFSKVLADEKSPAISANASIAALGARRP